MSRDKQSLRVIHAALRCTIRLVEHFLTHSWLPPSYYDSEAQGEKKKKVSDIRAFFCVYVFVYVSMSSYICVDRFLFKTSAVGAFLTSGTTSKGLRIKSGLQFWGFDSIKVEIKVLEILCCVSEWPHKATASSSHKMM